MEVPTVPYKDLKGVSGAEPSANIRKRVVAARQRQSERFARTKIYCNAQMNSRQVKRYGRIDENCSTLLESAIDKLGLSARAYNRILKIGCTIADLEGDSDFRVDHISEDIQYRSLDWEKRIV